MTIKLQFSNTMYNVTLNGKEYDLNISTDGNSYNREVVYYDHEIISVESQEYKDVITYFKKSK